MIWKKHSKKQTDHLTRRRTLLLLRHSNAKYQTTSSYLLHLSLSMLCPSWGYKGQSRWHEKKPLVVVVVWIGQTTIGNNDSIPSMRDPTSMKSKTTCILFVFFSCIIKRRWRVIGAKGCFRTWEVCGRERDACEQRGEKKSSMHQCRGRERDTAIIQNCTSRPTFEHYFNL